jgi:ABC-type transport system substrate-binding protein
MKSIFKLMSAMSRWERIVLGILTIVLGLSFLMLLRIFYVENTGDVPVAGGTYIEGAVGDVLPLNPWFVTGNDVNRDIVSLVFSGLMRFDPRTGKVIDDLATVKIEDNRLFTATLKPGLQWHDSTKENPHPVTADDVIFTFKTIQEQGFPNPILQQNFKGVDIEKIDERTVRFRLSKPYSFFTSNLHKRACTSPEFRQLPQTSHRFRTCS